MNDQDHLLTSVIDLCVSSYHATAVVDQNWFDCRHPDWLKEIRAWPWLTCQYHDKTS